MWGHATNVATRTVDVRIATLRQKLELNPSRPELIVTVHRGGCKFEGWEDESTALLLMMVVAACGHRAATQVTAHHHPWYRPGPSDVRAAATRGRDTRRVSIGPSSAGVEDRGSVRSARRHIRVDTARSVRGALL